MPKWNPCKRRTFIKKLKGIGFTAPEPGASHFYMRYGSYTFTVPSNQEYSVPQVKTLAPRVSLFDNVTIVPAGVSDSDSVVNRGGSRKITAKTPSTQRFSRDVATLKLPGINLFTVSI
jgi:hypothetical protein